MTESTLPLTGPKPQRSAPGQSFCAANARKLAVLLVLLLSGCLGLGLKFWLEIKASSVALDEMIGSHEVLALLHAEWRCTADDCALYFAECTSLLTKPISCMSVHPSGYHTMQ